MSRPQSVSGRRRHSRFSPSFLSQLGAGQPTQSPCVDAGGPGVGSGSTRTDLEVDSGVLDMGYHYPFDAFLRGDADDDGAFNIADVVFTLSQLFGGPSTSCLDATDANDDGAVDISDAVFGLSALFIVGAPRLPSPAVTCGVDPTVDFLSCVGPLLSCP